MSSVVIVLHRVGREDDHHSVESNTPVMCAPVGEPTPGLSVPDVTPTLLCWPHTAHETAWIVTVRGLADDVGPSGYSEYASDVRQ